MAFTPGLLLAGRYLLDGPIGTGGMSHVWRATDEVLARPVAVKTLSAPLVADPVLRHAIQREARAAASVTHPHVTQVYDFGEIPPERPGEEPLPYLVMELLDGEDLATRLRGGPMPWAEAVRVCAEVAEALYAAHQLGVVHRDIKPANVMLTGTGAKVFDFGIAVAAAQDGGVRGGTPAYVSPEVLAGRPGTAQSDVYALGAVLYEALTGLPPVSVRTLADAREAHRQPLDLAPITVEGIPDDVAGLCARCLRVDPATRPTAEEVAEVLGRYGAKRSRTAPPRAARTPAVVANPTLLDATPRPVVPTPPRIVVVTPQPRRARLALTAGGIVTIGLILLAMAAALSRTTDPVGLGSPAPTTTTAAAPTATTPKDPSTPAATLNAIDSTIAAALTSGEIENDFARDVIDDVGDLRRRVETGRGRDLGDQADDLHSRLDAAVRARDVDADVAAALEHLLDVLVRLADR